eukprot:CAMPEP_0116090304 /NCGR_PEP_ID=MMETSP0327-20121206/6892_1 /TAXON_ID=44447 /ORGANISM="Pseudo-nitzschia delicatissima, Strain B596" /LENGTH=41 /DNA_ID= /DNA_START= /DNA_END= /DNA_ORIENTATION=
MTLPMTLKSVAMMRGKGFATRSRFAIFLQCSMMAVTKRKSA